MSRIFVIDDSEVDFVVLENALNDSGYDGKLDYFMSADKALQEMLKLHEQGDLNLLPDLVLCDINMPGMNGFEFCVEKNKVDYFITVPVILVTNSNSPEDVKKGFQSGAVSVFNKKVDYDEFAYDISVLVEYWIRGCVAQIYKRLTV